MQLVIRNATVVTPGKTPGVATVCIDGGRIVSVGESSRRDAETQREAIDATGLIALPGFIDIHSHGRSGADFCDLTDEAFNKIGHG